MRPSNCRGDHLFLIQPADTSSAQAFETSFLASQMISLSLSTPDDFCHAASGGWGQVLPSQSGAWQPTKQSGTLTIWHGEQKASVHAFELFVLEHTDNGEAHGKASEERVEEEAGKIPSATSQQARRIRRRPKEQRIDILLRSKGPRLRRKASFKQHSKLSLAATPSKFLHVAVATGPKAFLSNRMSMVGDGNRFLPNVCKNLQARSYIGPVRSFWISPNPKP